jgi:GTP-binding protein
MTKLRNLAIIAHVDHGKTTMVDAMFRQSGTFRENQNIAERAMDSNDLEKERGITILAKCTSILWNQTRFNIVDTPGHADFGGEVERILSMVDGVLLLVDAAEGPMPQTKFVMMKALRLGLRPIVVLNKADRPDARADEVLNAVFDLFVALDATEEQLDFPVIYASAREGWAVKNLGTDEKESLVPLFQSIVDHVPEPTADVDAPFAMLATTLESDPYLGRILTGRIYSGKVVPNMSVKTLNSKGELVETGRLSKILAFRGLKREAIEQAFAGDIIAIAGLEKATVADTICAAEVTTALPSLPIDPPTLVMTFSINDSPLAGRDGTKVTSRMIRDRLMKESEFNVAVQVRESNEKDSFEVAGRGELQLGVLIETMRREGFELSISRPRVVYQNDPDSGARLEPIEEVQIDVDDEYTGVVVEKMGTRKADLVDMRPSSGGKTRIVFHAPARGLIGYLGEFMTDTRGTGVMSKVFHGYAPYKGSIDKRRNGVLICNGPGKVVAYALNMLEERGVLFVNPGDEAYEGMIIGENNRENDLDVNPLKAKQLTNMRASGKDEAIRLTPPRLFTLEQAMAYIQNDERVEVTPVAIRMRKALLDPNDRKRASRQSSD